MGAIELTDLQKRYREKVRKASVRKQKGRDENGEVRILYRLDVDSANFDVQFSKAFSLSVAKARKQQRKSAGKRDGSK